MPRRSTGLLAGLALFLLILAAAGIGFEQFARRRDRQRFPQVGRSFDIGGRSLNLLCLGEGQPTIILESNALTPGYSWIILQRRLATLTQTCWYDRAGYGWSDPAPAPHDGATSARDLHALLRVAGLAPPYLLTGDGFGSLNVRLYQAMYPSEVAGTVLVDPIVEEEERMGMAGRVPFHLGYPPDLILRAAGRLGLFRLLAPHRPERDLPPGWTPSEWATLSGLTRLPGMQAALLAEQGFTVTLQEVRASGSPDNRPQLILKGSDGRLLYDDPGRIFQAIQQIVAEIRKF